ncbi:S8 family peptidase [Streptomyces sp. NPDC015346]|uniref:S8 family peptidase n=1 Tax=Streptomyces sp. NPDC015346 TaxID=3364954 RepID=UPI0036FF1461
MRMPARIAAAAVPMVLASLLAAPGVSAHQEASAEPVPVPVTRTSGVPIPNSYIVMLKEGTDASAFVSRIPMLEKARFTYGSVLSGFAATLTDAQLAVVRKSPSVAAVEQNAQVAVSDGAPRALGATDLWGLDRIDQRALPLDKRFTTAGNGAGVKAYVLDTGIDYKHKEFGGRASFGFDAIGDGRDGVDCQGHGTHVAGTIGGTTYGVARKASLVGVRVLGCDGNGDWAGVIAGLDWIAKNAVKPAVMNSSLGGETSPAVDAAVDALYETGVLPVVAAGNSAVDACDISPARAAGALTVGATNQEDEETYFSNWGPCLSLYAPGQNILSAKLGGGSVALDGTSMAAPHVAGAAALYLGTNPKASSEDVAAWIRNHSTKDTIASISQSSPNRLLHIGTL